jgi:protein O-GlcNAc transferase
MADPSSHELFDSAAALLSAGQLPQAEAMFRKILAQQPNHDGALNAMGIIHFQSGNKDSGIIHVRKAIALNNTQQEYHRNLGQMLNSLGRVHEAVEAYRPVVRLRPHDAEAWNYFGRLLQADKNWDEAVAAFRRAVELRPDSALMIFQLAFALDQTGDQNGAIAGYRRAIKINPQFFEAYNNLGLVLVACDARAEAIEAYERALQLQSNNAEHLTNFGNLLRDDRQVDEALVLYDQALAARPDFVTAASVRIFSMHLSPHGDAQSLFQEHRRWDQIFGQPLRSEILPHLNDRQKDRRLRIGYVSADFREHSVVFFVENLLLHHDRKQIEVFCYSDVTHPDEITARLMKSADHWRESVSWNHAQLAQQIREDRIDILVDLAGHTSGSRLLTFARKPAPVQVTYCGYPNTTGLAAMDYRLTDQWADPSPQADALHTEKLVRLPRSFLCYRPPASAPPIGPLPSLANGVVTFGSFNALAKITAPMMAVWSQILRQVPRSRLLIKSHSGLSDSAPRERLLEIFGSLGIEADQIELIAKIPQMSAHLELYHRVDIALDTYPYHGTATTCEALWMGVPVITLAGQSHVSRVGVSLLNNVGLSELVANEPDDYVQLAMNIAKDSSRLSKLRAGMRDRLLASPLLDGSAFARELEKAYRQMWRAWADRPF